MTDTALPAVPDLTTLTVQLLSAYVANNRVDHGELAGLIQATRAALGAQEAARPAPELAPEPPVAYKRATSIPKSLADPDRIISMIDGKPYRTLTRHLKKHDLSPAEYRARYRLPADYPVIAPGYSEQRRQFARELGLGGRKRALTAAPAAPAEAEAQASEAAPAATISPAPPRARRAAQRKGNTAAAAAGAPAVETPDAAASAATVPTTRRRRAATRGGHAEDGGAPTGGKPPRRTRRPSPPTTQA